MATPDAGGPSRPPHVLIERDSDSQSISSDSTGPAYDFDQPAVTACRWRTEQYHDRECSRYFDCPSHLVERALSDADHASDTEQEEEHREEEPRPGSDPGTISPPSEGEDEHVIHTREEALSPDEPVIAGGATERGVGGHGTFEAASAQQEDAGQGSSTPNRPADNLPLEAQLRAEPDNGYGAAPLPPVPEPGRRARETVFGPPAINMAAASPAPATRLVSRPSPVLSTPAERTPSEVSLPRWQPDSEVTYCPICGTQFSIFVRKHHCRYVAPEGLGNWQTERLTRTCSKCGRVVCNSCSPHRITIPHQYIVRPPGAPRPLAQGPSLPLLDSQGWYPEFGGGERVRLCNPCVPDPNTAPPQTPGEQARSPQVPGSPVPADDTPLSNRWGFYFGAGTANDPQTRSRSVTLVCRPRFQSKNPSNQLAATRCLICSPSHPAAQEQRGPHSLGYTAGLLPTPRNNLADGPSLPGSRSALPIDARRRRPGRVFVRRRGSLDNPAPPPPPRLRPAPADRRGGRMPHLPPRAPADIPPQLRVAARGTHQQLHHEPQPIRLDAEGGRRRRRRRAGHAAAHAAPPDGHVPLHGDREGLCRLGRVLHLPRGVRGRRRHGPA